MEPVEVSDWATPIVCVPKTDGSVCICGDYKGTVNPVIHLEHFPIPTVEEIRSKVSTWNKFSKIDLRSAYQQSVLDEEAQKPCTANTHKGLFRYTRVYLLEYRPAQPYGSASLSKCCQELMELV